jgi:hypothetical protein
MTLPNGLAWGVSHSSDGAYEMCDPKGKNMRRIAGTFFMQIERVPQTPRVRGACNTAGRAEYPDPPPLRARLPCGAEATVGDATKHFPALGTRGHTVTIS